MEDPGFGIHCSICFVAYNSTNGGVGTKKIEKKSADRGLCAFLRFPDSTLRYPLVSEHL